MRPFVNTITLILSLAYLTPCVLGTGPYEVMMLWYLYRMDIIAYGPSQLATAPDCANVIVPKDKKTGKPVRSTCNFDELLKYIQFVSKSKPKRKWTGKTTVGDNPSPDPVKTANELATGGTDIENGSRYDCRFLASKVFPDVFNAEQGVDISFSKWTNTLREYVALCRQQVGDDKLVNELANMKASAIGAHETRLAKTAKIQIAFLNNDLKAKGCEWEVATKDITGEDGSTWKGYDAEKTIRDNSIPEPGTDEEKEKNRKLTDDLGNAVVNWTESEKVNDAEKANHASAFQALQGFQGELKAPVCKK